MSSLSPKILSLTTYKQDNGQKIDQSKSLPTQFKDRPFFQGLIPLDWLHRAANLPGRALHVAIGIWHLARLVKNRTVKLSQKNFRKLGLNRNAAYRGLAALEKEGLIRIERPPGQNSTVTILDI